MGCFESTIIEDELAVSISPADSGTISATGIACPGDCTEIYTTGTAITLTATETAGYQFDYWEQGGASFSTNNIVTFSINAASTFTITAVFVPVSTLNVSESPADSGSISATGITCPGDCSEILITDTDIVLTAAETTGFQFDHWEEGGAPISSLNPDTFTMSTDRTIVAVFVPVFTLDVSVSPADSG
ncbi:MAG: hypothetical protein GY841_18660, partial [FCB group bacterium]|nr:hypothetical protein [FCB group bacterium]